VIARARRGFTLLEVMIGLALLGFALVVLMKATAGNILSAEDSHLLGIATDLARGKMYDVEEKLIKDGFTDTDCSQTDWKPFDDEGWPTIEFSYKCEQVEMPAWDELQQMAQGHAKAMGSGSAAGSAFGSGAGFGSDQVGGFQNSALGGMLGMMGMFGGKTSAGGDLTSVQGGSLIQGQYTMFQQILKVTVRKVTLTVRWKVLGRDRDLKVVAFFTDPSAMDKVLNGLGSTELSDTTTTGTGSGSGRTTGTSGGSGVRSR
jgi:general secretion pathway protein I